MLILRSNSTAMSKLPILRSHHKISRLLLNSGLFVFGVCLLNTNSAQAWVPNSLGSGVKCEFRPAETTPTVASCQIGLESPQVGDKVITVLGYTPKLGSLDMLELSTQPFDPTTPWQVDLDLIPNRGPRDSGYLRYKLAITDARQYFSYAKLSNASGITNGGYSLKKEFYSDASFSPSALLPSWTLTNPPSPVGSAIFQSKTLFVMDSWTIDPTANGSLNAIDNSFAQSPADVPGPLALLGVVAGFGHSRLLRKRIKGSTLA
jgi:hypothetical protein